MRISTTIRRRAHRKPLLDRFPLLWKGMVTHRSSSFGVSGSHGRGMIEVNKSLLEVILRQHLAASRAVADHTIHIIECPGGKPNWDVITTDRAARLIIADMQRDYNLKWED